MALLDVNVLVALAWESHVHHSAARAWFEVNSEAGWATCAITEAGFVRVSANPKVMTHTLTVDAAREVLAAMRAVGTHDFLTNDVSITDSDVPRVAAHQRVTDAVLLTVAGRNDVRLTTFDAGIEGLAGPRRVELLER